MWRSLYRTIAWLCIIAHLNLIIPPFHEARAMAVEEEIAKGIQRTHPGSETFLQDELDLNSLSSLFNASNLWEGAYFVVSEIIPLTIGVISNDPISYGLYKVAQAVLDFS